jgi:hypothetical protein
VANQLALFSVSTVDVIFVCRLFSQMFFAANCGWSSRPTGRCRERSLRTWGGRRRKDNTHLVQLGVELAVDPLDLALIDLADALPGCVLVEHIQDLHSLLYTGHSLKGFI